MSGPGGVGKTRLAIELAATQARTHRERVRFVGLSHVTDVALVAPTILQSLGGHAGTDEPHEATLVAFIGSRSLLLILDNFEQVVEAAPLLTDLLAACPHLKLIVTSRTRLRLSGEYEFEVAPLRLTLEPGTHSSQAASEAVQLFVARASELTSSFSLSGETLDIVSDICRRLDGLPLAIELAAARIIALSPLTILERLMQQLPVLEQGVRDAPDRQRTLDATIAWSYDLLVPDEQYLFRHLSMFTNGCSLEAVETLVAGEVVTIDVFAALAHLIDHHLVYSREVPGATPRFHMLETVREHAFQLLAAAGEESGTRRRHAMAFLNMCESRVEGISEQAWLDLIEQEHGNVRSALEWSISNGNVDTSLRFVASLGLYFWLLRGYVDEGRRWARRVLGFGSGSSARVFAEVFIAASVFATYSSDFIEAEVLARKALAIEEAAGDRVGAGMALFHIAHALSARDGMDGTEAMLEEASVLLSAAQTLNERRVAALAFHNRAVAAALRGAYAQSRELAEEALARWRSMESDWGIAGTLGVLADTDVLRGDLANAVAFGQQVLAIRWTLGARMGVVDAMLSLARAVAASGVYEDLAGRLRVAANTLAAELGLVTVPEFQKVFPAEESPGDRFESPEHAPEKAQRDALAAVIAEVLAIPAASLRSDDVRNAPVQQVHLTAREWQVLRLVARRRTDQDIADHLFLSRRTISGHVAHSIAKLGVSTRQEAVSRARNMGILPWDDRFS